jgi:hypothetical protein
MLLKLHIVNRELQESNFGLLSPGRGAQRRIRRAIETFSRGGRGATGG